MKKCTSCSVELQESINWSHNGGHNFCRSCYNEGFNDKRMFLNGKYIPFKSPIHKPGNFKSLDDAWSHQDLDSKVISGEIYLIINPAFSGWVKVGMSINAVDRLHSYQTSDPFRSYSIYASFKTDDRHKTEKRLHKLLEKTFEKRNEWFKGDAESIKQVVESQI